MRVQWGLSAFGLLGAASGLAACVERKKQPTEAMLYGSELSPFSHVVRSYAKVEGLELPYIEVEPYKKKQMHGLDTNIMPCLVTPDGKVIVKAQEIIEELENSLQVPVCGPFSVEQKNQCMLMNEQLVPLIGLCRHLTYGASRETVQYMDGFRDQWGSWDTFWAKLMLPIFYWRRWRKMGYKILVETGYEDCTASPPEALFRELEKQQQRRDHGRPFLGGNQLSVEDVWLYGLVQSMRNETLYERMNNNCPRTAEWLSHMHKKV